MNVRALVAWNLRRLRVERGVSQEALAFGARVDRAYVGGLERKVHNPTIDLLERLASTLGTEVSEFFVKIPKGASPLKPLPAGRKVAKRGARKKQ
jgi:transcriptional regulator with XRE-family HTH domain